MSHVTKELPWCAINLDTNAGKIAVVERWQYDWYVAPPYRRWTPSDMQAFHQRVQREVWAAWSNRAFLSVAGASSFAQRFASRPVPVFMDVRRVIAKPHWTVYVTRVPEGLAPTSKTNWVIRRIRLDSHDTNPMVRCVGPARNFCMTQTPVAHEFGHTIGNSSRFGRGDEYPADSPHSTDFDSIMHIGIELRNRHFEHLLTAINGILEDTTFTLGRLV